MDKQANVLGRIFKSVGNRLATGTGRVGNVGSRLVDQGERMVERTAATTAAKAQNRVIDQALAKKLPSMSPAQQIRTRDAVNARSAQRMSEAKQLPPAMAERTAAPAAAAVDAAPFKPLTSIPPAPTPPPGVAAPAAPTPAAPTAEVTPGTPAPMISANAKKYLAIGAGGLAGGAMLSGGISGGSAAGRQQQMAPTAYPPGY
jgi:hypothetical protein